MNRVLLLLSVACLCSLAASDVLDYVNPLIGTLNGGHVFPGATLPYGMAKAGPDTATENQGGFSFDGGVIEAWSHMHDSGTGGGSSFGQFPVWPVPNCFGNISQCNFDRASRGSLPIKSSISAEPGLFSLQTQNGVTGAATVANRTALHRFTFQNSTTYPLILLGLESIAGPPTNPTIKLNSKTGRVTGSGVFTPSFGIGTYTFYFCADFFGASIRDLGYYAIDGGLTKPSGQSIANGTYIRFQSPQQPIYARVGLSFISAAQACSNAENEIPSVGPTPFNALVATAQDAWRQKLNVVSIDSTGVGTNFQTIFWSGLYRNFISPQDYTGENPLWTSSEPYFDSFYCIWDSFRATHPLFILLDPQAQTLMVRSLIDTYVHLGKLPDCRMSLDKGYTQGGSNADVVLAESYLKGINVDVDWNTGYQAVVSDAEVEPANWLVEGRGDLVSWHNKHYIPKNDIDTNGTGLHTRSVSRSLEYAYDDFCIAQMAHVMGNAADEKKYFGRSGYWQNVFKASQTSFYNGADTGFVGFVQPKFYNGSWAYQNPLLCSPLDDFTGCYLNPGGHATYEGSCWLYTFFAPGDMALLVKMLGGSEKFVQRLDYMHDNNIVYIGDEQAFLTVYQYHHAGRPAKSAARAHYYIPSEFNTTHIGIPGNDDSGAMGAFAAFSMMGFFPNAGQNVYYITPPFFPSISITNGQTGNVATIKNINFDPTYKGIYIQSATLNGQPYTNNWIDHGFFTNGGTLELTLGTTESSWGTGNSSLPPSLSTGGPHY